MEGVSPASGVGGPWIVTAMFCDDLDTERPVVVDRVTIARERPPRLALMLLVVRGEQPSPFPLAVEGRSPDGDLVAEIELEIADDNAPEHVCRVFVPIGIEAVRDGVYWFTVRTGERTLVRVPLRVQWA